MKFRIASSVALAAALALGATGCSLISAQGTLKSYDPSDGVGVAIGDVKLRNIMLVADESGENFNVVFGSVNTTGQDQDITLNFVGEGATATAEFAIPGGNTTFGDPEGAESPVLVTLPDLAVGATVTTYFQAAGADEVEYQIPVLDGTLKEYENYVLPAGFADEADDEADEAAAQSHTGDEVAEEAETEEPEAVDAE